MASNTKERSEAIQEAARALLDEQQIDVTAQVVIRPLAKLLAARMDCHYDTAKRHVATAIRCARGEFSSRQWGGSRGGGRPPRERSDA